MKWDMLMQSQVFGEMVHELYGQDDKLRGVLEEESHTLSVWVRRGLGQ